MLNLKELIKQAKNNEIPLIYWDTNIWNTRIRLKSKIVVKKSLNKLSSENWNKIRHIAPNWMTIGMSLQQSVKKWNIIPNVPNLIEGLLDDQFWGESLTKQIAESGRLIRKDDKKFASREILEEFKKYADKDSELKTNERKKKVDEISEDDIIEDNSDIINALKKGDKIYGKEDACTFQSEDALRFLQSIINDDFLSTIEYKKDEVFKLEEWKNNNENELDAEAKILIRYFPKDIERLDLSNKNLKGEWELDLSEFSNLKKLDCSHNQLTSLDLSENVNLVYLECSYNQLKGKLYLTNNKLTGLDCSFNELEELVISNCPNLEMIVCNNNKLKYEKFMDIGRERKNNLKNNLLDNLNFDKLICLNISDNNLQGNLDDFKEFTKLEVLWIGSGDENKIKKEGIYNKFSGSLESLEDMTKLESLHISNTDIDGYSDRLPNNVEIYYSTEERPNSKLNKIKEKLEKYKNYPSQLTKLKEELEILERKIKEMEFQALIEIPSSS